MIIGTVVTLRPIEDADLPVVHRWQNDPRIMEGWAMPSPILSHSALAADLPGRFAHFDGAGHFIIDVGGNPVGRISYDGLEERHRSAELSLYIGDLAAQGKGYAMDAVVTLTRYLFTERRASRVELTVIDTNARARALYESLGFVLEGTLRGYIHFAGAFHDELLMAVYAEDDLRHRRPQSAMERTY